jgi:hypothetical protein
MSNKIARRDFLNDLAAPVVGSAALAIHPPIYPADLQGFPGSQAHRAVQELFA